MQSLASPTMLADRRVLVVEDEALVSRLFADELHDAGADVLTASTLADALHLVEAAARDGGLSAAVLDINIGGEAVLPVADALAGLGVPFLFATGYGEGCGRGRHTAAPVLHKPFEPRDLTAALQALAAEGAPRHRAPG
jgi:DNA-binding response OmpR family regulator